MNLEVVVMPKCKHADLEASDFDSRQELHEALRDALSGCRTGELFELLLHPPLPKGESALTVLDELHRLNPPGIVRVLVESERARAAIEDHLPRLASPAERPQRTWSLGGTEVRLVIGDITETGCEAVINASNTRLELGGGVSAALKRATTPGLQVEMFAAAAARDIRPGDVVVTGAHGLAGASWLLHAATVSGSRTVVDSALQQVFEAVAQLGARSLAVPLLGTGTGGLAVASFGAALADAILARRGADSLKLIVVVCWTMSAFRSLENDLGGALGPPTTAARRHHRD